MKTIISTIFLCVLLSFIPELRAQNIQLHYDFGRSLYDKDLKEQLKHGGNIEAAKVVGAAIAKNAKAKGIECVVFDRGGFLYHGRVAALADAAREAGLMF